MKKLFNTISFEQLMVLLVFVVLSVVLFLYGENKEILNFILGAFVGAFTNNLRNKTDEETNK